MTPDDLAAFLADLPRCKRKGRPGRPAWYVDDRLVCRLEDLGTLVVRSGYAEREEILAAHPEVFGVTPRMERHELVQVALDLAARTPGADDAVRRALVAAYERQRKRPIRSRRRGGPRSAGPWRSADRRTRAGCRP